MVGLTKYLIGAMVLIVGVSGCERSCEATCRKVLKCEGLPTNELSIGECNAECVRQGEYFEDNEDDDFGFAVRIGGAWMAIGAKIALEDPDVGGRVYMYKFNTSNSQYELKSILISPNGPETSRH